MGGNLSCFDSAKRSAGGRNAVKLGVYERAVYDLCGNLIKKLKNRTEDDAQLATVCAIMEDIKRNQAAILDSEPDRAESLEEFQRWCEEERVKADQVDIQICPNEGGMGIVARKDIAKDSEVFRVKFTSMINSAKGKKRSSYLTTSLGISDAWVQIPVALELMRHMFRPDSRFRPYLNVLPKVIAHPVMFEYTDFEHMKGTTAYGSCLGLFYEVYSHYAAMYRKIYEDTLLGTLPTWESLSPLNFTAEVYIWAMTIALTRTLKVHDDKEHAVTVMVPYWDLCNNGTEDIWTSVTLKVDETSDSGYTADSALAAYAYDNIPAGKEIQLVYRESTTPVEYLTVWGIVVCHYIKVRTEGASFLQIYVTLPAAVAKSRNENEKKVKDSVSVKIYKAPKVVNQFDADMLMRSFTKKEYDVEEPDWVDRGFIWSRVVQFLDSNLRDQAAYYTLSLSEVNEKLRSNEPRSANMDLALRYLHEEMKTVWDAIDALPQLLRDGPPEPPKVQETAEAEDEEAEVEVEEEYEEETEEEDEEEASEEESEEAKVIQISEESDVEDLQSGEEGSYEVEPDEAGDVSSEGSVSEEKQSSKSGSEKSGSQVAPDGDVEEQRGVAAQ